MHDSQTARPVTGRILNRSRPDRSRLDRSRPRWLGALVGTAVLLVLSLTATGAHAATNAGATAARDAGHRAVPTIVLVHGAWGDPSTWQDVVTRLHQDGYRTATPRLGLLSLDADVATVRATLDGIKGKKILVAHSYGGAVISNASYGRTDLLGLVYSAAFVPDEGDSLLSLGTGFAPSDVINHLVFTGDPFASPAFIDPAFFRQLFAQDLSTKAAAKLSAAQQPLNFPIFGTPSGPVGWHTLPSWYAVSGADRMIDPAQERWMAGRMGATTIEFPTASHIGGVTVHAGRFTRLIEQAVCATSH